MPEEQPVASQPEDRPARADAARNHSLVLTAACEIFAKAGPEAQIEDVARRAGVGIGTVYRRFGTKEALLAAVIDVRRRELTQRAAVARHAGDPVEGIAGLVRSLAASAAADRALLATFLPTSPIPDDDGSQLSRVEGVATALTELLDRSRHQGRVRADVTAEALGPLITGLVLAASQSQDSASWERSLGIVLDGIAVPERGVPR